MFEVGIEGDAIEAALVDIVDFKGEEGIGKHLSVFDDSDPSDFLCNKETSIGGEGHRCGIQFLANKNLCKAGWKSGCMYCLKD